MALFEPATLKWTPISAAGGPDMTTTTGIHVVRTSVDTFAVAHSFSFDGGANVARVHVYNFKTSAWRDFNIVRPAQLAPTRFLYNFRSGTKLVFMGGTEIGSPSSLQSDGFAFDLATEQTALISYGTSLSPRSTNGFAPFGKTPDVDYLVWGGSRGYQLKDCGDGYSAYEPQLATGGAIYNVLNNTWTPVTSQGMPPAQVSFNRILTDSAVMFFGAYSSSLRFDCATHSYSGREDVPGFFFFNAKTGTWFTIPNFQTLINAPVSRVRINADTSVLFKIVNNAVAYTADSFLFNGETGDLRKMDKPGFDLGDFKDTTIFSLQDDRRLSYLQVLRPDPAFPDKALVNLAVYDSVTNLWATMLGTQSYPILANAKRLLHNGQFIFVSPDADHVVILK